MYVSAAESRVLARIFGLLSEDLSEHDVREAVGHHLLELLEADYYASFVWQDAAGRFDKAVFLNMIQKTSQIMTAIISTTIPSPSSSRRVATPPLSRR